MLIESICKSKMGDIRREMINWLIESASKYKMSDFEW